MNINTSRTKELARDVEYINEVLKLYAKVEQKYKSNLLYEIYFYKNKFEDILKETDSGIDNLILAEIKTVKGALDTFISLLTDSEVKTIYVTRDREKSKSAKIDKLKYDIHKEEKKFNGKIEKKVTEVTHKSPVEIYIKHNIVRLLLIFIGVGIITFGSELPNVSQLAFEAVSAIAPLNDTKRTDDEQHLYEMLYNQAMNTHEADTATEDTEENTVVTLTDFSEEEIAKIQADVDKIIGFNSVISILVAAVCVLVILGSAMGLTVDVVAMCFPAFNHVLLNNSRLSHNVLGVGNESNSESESGTNNHIQLVSESALYSIEKGNEAIVEERISVIKLNDKLDMIDELVNYIKVEFKEQKNVINKLNSISFKLVSKVYKDRYDSSSKIENYYNFLIKTKGE